MSDHPQQGLPHLPCPCQHMLVLHQQMFLLLQRDHAQRHLDDSTTKQETSQHRFEAEAAILATKVPAAQPATRCAMDHRMALEALAEGTPTINDLPTIRGRPLVAANVQLSVIVITALPQPILEPNVSTQQASRSIALRPKSRPGLNILRTWRRSSLAGSCCRLAYQLTKRRG